MIADLNEAAIAFELKTCQSVAHATSRHTFGVAIYGQDPNNASILFLVLEVRTNLLGHLNFLSLKFSLPSLTFETRVQALANYWAMSPVFS